jgi:hypothetical protein
MNTSYFLISVILGLATAVDAGFSQTPTSMADSVFHVEIDTEPPDQRVDVIPNDAPDSSGGEGSHGDSLDHTRTSIMHETTSGIDITEMKSRVSTGVTIFPTSLFE